MVAVGKLTAMPQVTMSLVRWSAEYQVIRRVLPWIPSVYTGTSYQVCVWSCLAVTHLRRQTMLGTWDDPFFSENLVDF